jgi:hypothetical protein
LNITRTFIAQPRQSDCRRSLYGWRHLGHLKASRFVVDALVESRFPLGERASAEPIGMDDPDKRWESGGPA